MPSPAPFFAHGRVLCTTNGHAQTIAAVADIASDTLSDLLRAPFFDLARQERVGYGRTGRANKIHYAPAYLGDHGVRRCKTPHGYNRLAGDGFDVVHRFFQGSFPNETRHAHFVLVVVYIDIPEIGQFSQHFEYFPTFG